MIPILIPTAVMLSLLLFFTVSWHNSRKDNAILKVKKTTRIINLGSTWAYYDIDYNGSGVSGVNLANCPQFLDYDLIILKKVISKLDEGTIILITLADFVFAGKNTDSDRRQYYEVLNRKEIGNYSVRKLFKYVFLAATEPFTHYYQKKRDKWKGYVASDEDKLLFAQRRISDWENPNGYVRIPSVKKGDVTDEHKERIKQNIEIVMNIISVCHNHSMKPYILILPQSAIMRKEISDECLEVYLRAPISRIVQESAFRNWDLGILDYSTNEELSDMKLYMNGDCFNNEGRKVFTDVVLTDVGLFY